MHVGRVKANHNGAAKTRQDEAYLEVKRPPPAAENAALCERSAVHHDVRLGSVTPDPRGAEGNQRCEQQNGGGHHGPHDTRGGVE